MRQKEKEGRKEKATLSMWGMSFTDFRVPRKEFISSSEERKNDILIVKENRFDNDEVDLKSQDFKNLILYFQIRSFKRWR